MGGLTYRPRSCHLTLLVTLLRTGFASYGAPQAEVAAPEIAGEVVHPAPYVAQAAPADAAAPVAGAAFRPEAAAQPVVPLPTSTVTFTTTPPLLLPVQVSPNLEPGLVGELFDFKSKTSTVAVIDRTVHHWGDVYSELAMKWTGLLFIQQPGVYHFQITCMGAAELRIDGSILIKEDTLLTQRASIPSNPVTLPAGHHAILIGYTELEGQAGFAINYIGPDTQNMLKLIPAHALMHEKGPCDLRSILGADNIACGDKDRPRWALASGESCEVHCSWGRYPLGMPGSSSFISCHNGQLSRPDFKCSPMRCSEPKVLNIGTPGCKEGAQVDDGATCAPRCADGFAAIVSEPLTCHNGTMSGSLSCQPRRSCAAPARERIAHVGIPSCLTGSSIPHGARCGAFCAHGFEPEGDPICQDGVLMPEVFSCRPLQRSSTTQLLQAAPVWYETTRPEVFLGSSGPPISGLPATLFISAVAAALLSAGACIFVSLAKRKTNKKRGLLIGDSRRSISTDYSGHSSDGSDRSGSASGSEAYLSPSQSPKASRHRPTEAKEETWRQEEVKRSRMLAEERRRETQHKHEEKRQALQQQQLQQRLEQQQQQQQQDRDQQSSQPPPKERILGSSYRSGPVPAPKRAPVTGRRYAEDMPPHWGDVRVGDHNPAKANRIPWSDVRIG